MQRSMSYDLDGVFASRNQGQLLSGGTHVRTPGLQQVTSSQYRQGRKIPFDGLGVVQVPRGYIRYGRKWLSPGQAAAWAKTPAGVQWIRAHSGINGYTQDRTMRLNGPDDDITTSSDVDDQSTVPAVPVPGAPAAAAAPAPAKDNTKLYLALGAAAAAYFLFFRK